MFAPTARRAPADRRVRLHLESCEDRLTPAFVPTFVDYGTPNPGGMDKFLVTAGALADNTPLDPTYTGHTRLGTANPSVIYQSLSVTSPLTPYQADPDPDYDRVRISIKDNDATPTHIALLVYRKMDSSVPPNVIASYCTSCVGCRVSGRRITSAAGLPRSA